MGAFGVLLCPISWSRVVLYNLVPEVGSINILMGPEVRSHADFDTIWVCFVAEISSKYGHFVSKVVLDVVEFLYFYLVFHTFLILKSANVSSKTF
jgi:hypothetical protein